jgi:hypothetical protein
MKKQLTVLGISVLIITGAAITAYAQQKDNKGKKEQDKGQGNNGKQSKQGNGNSGGKANGQPANGNSQKGNQGKNTGKGKDAGNNGNDNNGKGNAKGNGNNGNSSNNANNNGKRNNNDNNGKDGYSWNDDNFKDRKKLKDQEKVTICHKVNNNNEPGVTLRVSSNATKAHMNHGDAMGECTGTANGKFSDIFLRKRTDYYNSLQNSYEQVSYSRSILDYAVQKLTNSRLQLANMQSNNVPRAELERKQATVVELEQNVSLLETLIGVTANIVANKLQR